MDLNRRGFLAAAGIGALSKALPGVTASDHSNSGSEGPVPMIHVTDLFRPPSDPDDHWDLACVFALAFQGKIDLKAVLVDSAFGYSYKGKNPDIAAVAQMNYITSQAAAIAIGSPHKMTSRTDVQPQASATEHGGIAVLLNMLEESRGPVVINVVGSCRDIAIAGRKRPDLFAKKCKAIYLNAGNGDPDQAGQEIEWNVKLEPFAYAATFDIPCPIYWMPCINGTYYNFQQGAILPYLSDRVQNFFAYMFAAKQDHNWLGYLTGEKDQAVLDEQGRNKRNMWCTGGFFHAVGEAVLSDGRIIDSEKTRDGEVCGFEPVRIECNDEGRTKWTPDANSSNRFIFRVHNKEKYGSAMTAAMKSLLTLLP